MLAKRTLMRYNVENRAFKEIERQTNRPVVAPKHEAGTINYHKAMQGIKKKFFYKQLRFNCNKNSIFFRQ